MTIDLIPLVFPCSLSLSSFIIFGQNFALRPSYNLLWHKSVVVFYRFTATRCPKGWTWCFPARAIIVVFACPPAFSLCCVATNWCISNYPRTIYIVCVGATVMFGGCAEVIFRLGIGIMWLGVGWHGGYNIRVQIKSVSCVFDFRKVASLSGIRI